MTTYVATLQSTGYDTSEGDSFCSVSMRTAHEGGAGSLVVLDFDNYFEATTAFTAMGGKFAPEDCDDNGFWSSQRVTCYINETTWVTIWRDER
jgi:hypothetical protein